MKPIDSDPAARGAQPNLATLPQWTTRIAGAGLVSRHYFPMSPRTLETWPLDWKLVNGHAVCQTTDLLRVAQEKLDAGLPLHSTRRHPARASERSSVITAQIADGTEQPADNIYKVA